MSAPAAGTGVSVLPPAAAEARLKALYSVMQSIENKLGGGEGVEGLYGSIKKSGMDKVLDCLRQHCGLDQRSWLVDIGAGLGRPLMHALLEPGVAGGLGIEIDRIKCDKAGAFLQQAIKELQRRGLAGAGQLVPPEIQCSAIEQIRCLDPCTHAYSFWEGVPYDGKAAFGSLFAASRTLRSVAVVQRAIRTCPLEYMEDLGFGELVLVGTFSVSMSGSGRSFTAYVFNKTHLPAHLPAPLAAEQAAAQSVETPGQAAEAGPAVSLGTVASAAELEGECAQSRLVAAAAAADTDGGVLAAAGRGRRQRKPSAKQQAAVEEAGQQQLRQAARQQQQAPSIQRLSAREQRAGRRNEAVWEAARAAGQQQQAAVEEEQQEGVTTEQQQQALAAEQQQRPVALLEQAAAIAAAVVPTSPTTRAAAGKAAATAAAAAAAESSAKPMTARNASRPAAGGPAAAGKLSSPQQAGVQKRASPSKAGTSSAGSPQKAVRTAAASRQLALAPAVLVAAGKGGGDKLAPGGQAPGGGGVPHWAARVLKSGLDSVAKLRPVRQVAAARRGLRGEHMDV